LKSKFKANNEMREAVSALTQGLYTTCIWHADTTICALVSSRCGEMTPNKDSKVHSRLEYARTLAVKKCAQQHLYDSNSEEETNDASISDLSD
jgi:alpha-tubulin suppressor-like RCC1 family protein